MKRPLVYLGVAFLLLMAIFHRAESRGNGSLYDSAVSLLEEEAAKSGGLTVNGIVSDCNAVSAGLRLSIDHLTIQKKETSYLSLQSDLKLTFTIEYTDERAEVQPGDRVAAEGKFRAYERPTNPGQFDSRGYYSAQNIIGTLNCTKFSILYSADPGIVQAAYWLRCVFRRSYTEILEERSARTIAAISLGEKGWMEREWKETYQEGGIAHILSISGLHISLVGMGVYRLLRRMGLRFGIVALLSGGILMFYVLLVGFSIPAVRAMIMFFVWMGAQVCGRKYDMLTGSAVAAALLVGADAGNLFQSSFLLSFSAILSLAVLAPALIETCRIRTAAGKSAAVSVAVWMGTLPCTLYFFFQASPWSIFVNLAVVPLMTILMISGLAAAAVGIVSVKAGIFLAAPVHYLLACFEGLCSLEKKLPAPVWVAGRPLAGCMILYYAAVLAVICFLRERDSLLLQRKADGKQKKAADSRKEKYRAIILWICCGTFCIFLMNFHPRTGLKIDCLDVGQGDCTLVRLPEGENCLIDGGSTSKSSVWEYMIEPAVKYYGIRTIDYIFLSHADADHINGILEYLEKYACGFNGKNIHGVSVKHIVLPVCQETADFSDLKYLADAKGIEIQNLEAGGSLRGKSWQIRCLAPSADSLTGDRNEDSMVLMLSYGQFRMLFTGDLEGNSEKRLALSGKDLRADILKVGHHGSSGASSSEFLDQVSPKAAVISCGRDNRYGHPADETLQRLEASQSDIFVTSQCGAVGITTDGTTFAVKSAG
ncbi:MAG: DNA internalization-related competence protein ComEC/Rec2, partial [Lachnospiraceae bacterium]|nr:DNA internalization-related competence protein ComEC/Rec2 [Lachnospiraceae bacterium]